MFSPKWRPPSAGRKATATSSIPFPGSKIVALIGLAILALLLVGPAAAQAEATTLEQLVIDIWPDYDRQAALILLTASRPPDAGEERLTIPLPETAELNAVARVSTEGALVTDELEVDQSTPGLLAITTAAPQIRVEYYLPYETDGDRRQFTFSWTSDMVVERLIATIQQPMVSRDFVVSPQPIEVSPGRDGLQYHSLPEAALAPGETYSFEASYTNPGGQLTADLLTEQQPLTSSTGASVGGDGFNWLPALAAGGGVLVIAAIAYLALGRRSAQSRPHRPRPQRATPARSARAGGKPRFCHQCGQPAAAGDKFCSSCGTQLKRV